MLPVLGCKGGVAESLIWTTPPRGGVCSGGEGLPDTHPPTPAPHRRGESLPFEQIRHQLPPTCPQQPASSARPAHASLGHLSCVPCTETFTHPTRRGMGPP